MLHVTPPPTVCDNTRRPQPAAGPLCLGRAGPWNSPAAGPSGVSVSSALDRPAPGEGLPPGRVYPVPAGLGKSWGHRPLTAAPALSPRSAAYTDCALSRAARVLRSFGHPRTLASDMTWGCRRHISTSPTLSNNASLFSCGSEAPSGSYLRNEGVGQAGSLPGSRADSPGLSQRWARLVFDARPLPWPVGRLSRWVGRTPTFPLSLHLCEPS